MKFLAQLVVIALLGFILSVFFPWWGIAVAGIIGGFLFSSRASFLAGFLGAGLLWFLVLLYIETTAAAPLAGKIASLFSEKVPLTSTTLMLLVGCIGGLVGGFSAMTGSLLRPHVKKNSNQYRI